MEKRILRIEKVKSAGEMNAIMHHNYRAEKETPNADPAIRDLNEGMKYYPDREFAKGVYDKIQVIIECERGRCGSRRI